MTGAHQWMRMIGGMSPSGRCGMGQGQGVLAPSNCLQCTAMYSGMVATQTRCRFAANDTSR